ncbi:MAG: hypothetical protein AAF685_00470 [Cyanobacteria bacterium P01_C01_bin.89]
MADSRIAFLTGCALTGAMAFAVAKGWVNIDTQALTSAVDTGDSLGTTVDDVPLDGELPPPPPPASSLNSVPMSPAAMSKLEEQLKKQAEQNTTAIATLREDLQKQRADLAQLQDKLSGQDETLASMALDDRLSELADRNDQPFWTQGILWALGGMVLTVSSIVMAGVFAMMARNSRDRSTGSQPFHSIRVVPSYLPGREHPELVTPRRPSGSADYIDYDY